MEEAVIFIDTGAFYARHRSTDDHHRSAVDGWNRIVRERPRCFTSNFVIAESVTLLARTIGHQRAAERARNMISSPILTILRTSIEEELEAVDLLEKFADQKVNFVDCLSFVLMRRHRIHRFFGFDRHFEMVGFAIWPLSGKRK